MRPTRPAAGLLALALVLAGCGSAASPTPIPTASPPPTAGATATPTPVQSPTETPTEAPYNCTFPWTSPGTTDRAQLTDVQVATNDGYDRIIFTFAGENAFPELEIAPATPPFTQDPSGLPLAVSGTVFLRIVMRGGTAVAPDGTVTYDGPTAFAPEFPQLRQLVRAGDFEAVSTWIAGLNAPACFRLSTETGPSRLLIDLQHPAE